MRLVLTSQIQRAALSILSNTAEGFGRNSPRDFARCLKIASGSACELESLLVLCRDLALINAEEYARFSNEPTQIQRMLSGLIRHLNSRA